MKYENADDLQRKFEDIILTLGMSHVRKEDVVCIRSFGTSSRGTIARCHALNKVMQKALKRSGFYVLEFLSERYDSLSEEQKIKILIHEIMHIPKSFGGGFKYHDYVCERNINKMYQQYLALKCR